MRRLIWFNSIASWLVLTAVSIRYYRCHHLWWSVFVWITTNYIFRVSSRHLRIIKRISLAFISSQSILPLKKCLASDTWIIASVWINTKLTSMAFHPMHTTWWHTCRLSVRIWIINSLVVRIFILFRVVMYSHTFFKLLSIIRLHYHVVLGYVL